MSIVSRFSRLALALVALTAMLAVASRAQAEDTPATGSKITGQVVDASGAGVKGASVKLMAGTAGHGKKPAPAFTIGNSAVALAKGEKHAALQEATTDDKGNFTFTNVAAGDYTVIATGDDSTGAKLGGHEKVTVTAGSDATVTLTLKAHKKKAA